jgi:site-specific recombinase XerC
LRDRPITDLKLPEIIGLIDRVGKKTPTLARRLHSYLHRILKWARSRDKIETNPPAGVEKTGKETKRKRIRHRAHLGLACGR